MGREFELKYRAVPEQQEAIAACYSDFAVIRMETTYYEAPSGVFGQRHWTLRRRMENEVSVCTLKTNLAEGGRGEWEVVCDDILAAVPLLISIGAPEELAALTADGVSPTCGARFIRRAVGIPVSGGKVELALDRGILLGGGQEEPLCEVEVELKEGPDEAAISFASVLAERFQLIPEPKSKLRRALALAGR